jgi:hypothetical protein
MWPSEIYAAVITLTGEGQAAMIILTGEGQGSIDNLDW